VATPKQKTKVGVFLITCFTIMVVGITVISGYYEDPGDQYWLEFDESILGLYEGGMVEYLGVPVGRVREIYVTPNQKAHVSLALDPTKVTLHPGVEAQLVLYSFAAGTMAISLRGGDPNLPSLTPGSEIPARPSTITAISSQVEDIMENMAIVVGAVKDGLDGLEEGELAALIDHANKLLGESHLMVEDGRTLVNNINQTIGDVRGDVAAFTNLSVDIKELANEVKLLITTTTGKIDQLDIGQTERNAQELMNSINELTQRLNRTVDNFDDMSSNVLHEVDNVEYTLRTSLQELNEVFGSMRMLLEELRTDPASLIRGRGTVRESQ